MNVRPLEDEVAIVTGGTRGLGLATTQRLLHDGARVALCGRFESTVVETLNYLRPNDTPSAALRGYVCDVANPDDVVGLIDRVHADLGSVDILVCNAGIQGPIGPTDLVDWQAWVRTVEINLFGTVLCCRAVLPDMRERGRGKIIALSGGGATSSRPRFSAYAASKTAIVRFIETLADEVAEDGIDVNAVSPGALNTHMLDEVLAAGPFWAGEEAYANAQVQQERGGSPLETAAALIAFLASPACDGISGRLISALWDNWQHLPEERVNLVGNTKYTLRRML